MEKKSMATAITDLRARMIALKVATESSIKPCTDEEIAEVEAAAGVPLPGAYREFLKHMGRWAGNLFTDIEIFYPDVLTLRPDAEELLRDSGCPPLPDNAFVFSMCLGYQFMYFLCETGNDDPPVYHYMEGDTAPVLRRESFVKFLTAVVAEHER